VHKLRTEARHLLACLHLLRGLVSTPALAKATRSLKQQLHSSNALRDVHVQMRLTGESAAAESDLQSLRRQLRDAERREARKLKRILKRTKIAKRIAALKRCLRRVPKTRAADLRLRTRLDAALARQFRRMVQLQRRAMADLDCLHRARIALKKLRYMGEALRPVPGPASAATAELGQLQSCQAKQGAIHDLDLMLARLATDKNQGQLQPMGVYRTLHRRRAALRRSGRTLADRCFRDHRVLSRMKLALRVPGRAPRPRANHA
jgi:CHAD domain-containing protein